MLNLVDKDGTMALEDRTKWVDKVMRDAMRRAGHPEGTNIAKLVQQSHSYAADEYIARQVENQRSAAIKDRREGIRYIC